MKFNPNQLEEMTMGKKKVDKSIVEMEVTAESFDEDFSGAIGRSASTEVNPEEAKDMREETPKPIEPPKPILTDEQKKAIRSDAVKRSWASRRKLFGQSGYKAGHSPLRTGESKSGVAKVTYTPEEKKARRAASVQAAWAKRKTLYGDSGYKAGHSPLIKTGTDN